MNGMNFLAAAAELPESLGGKAEFGLQTALIGMLIVFAVLVIIMLVIYLFQLMFYDIPRWSAERRAKADAQRLASAPGAEIPQTAPQTAEPESDPGELIAVLSAAVAAYLGETETPTGTSRYRIRSFRRLK